LNCPIESLGYYRILREELAQQMVKRLRRTGKTPFLQNDLIPALEADGAIVIYVDLWSDTQRSPSSLILSAVKKALGDLESGPAAAAKKLRHVAGAEVGAIGFKFGFKLENLGEAGGATLAQALSEVIEQAQTDVVLIVDEVQHAITTKDGSQILFALKAARDIIRSHRHQQPGCPGPVLGRRRG